jgi:hypothetical protein
LLLCPVLFLLQVLVILMVVFFLHNLLLIWYMMPVVSCAKISEFACLVNSIRSFI